jgi:hypothetical protein
MLVRMLKLRHLGQRLSLEALRSAKPDLGYLYVIEEVARRYPGKRDIRMAMLKSSPHACEGVENLHGVRLVKIDQRGLVLAGVEEHWHRKQRTDYRQAWWCWPVMAADVARDTAPDPELAADEAAALAAALGPYHSA